MKAFLTRIKLANATQARRNTWWAIGALFFWMMLNFTGFLVAQHIFNLLALIIVIYILIGVLAQLFWLIMDWKELSIDDRIFRFALWVSLIVLIWFLLYERNN